MQKLLGVALVVILAALFSCKLYITTTLNSIQLCFNFHCSSSKSSIKI